MVIHYFDIVRVASLEVKANPPLGIDANAPPTFAVARKLLKPVRRRYAQIFQRRRRMQQSELVKRSLLNVRWQTFDRLP